MANLPGWSYYKIISITGQSGAGSNYQIELEIGDSAGGNFHLEGHCTNFPQDIRITDDDGTTLLDHWVEDITADPIKVWVEVADDLGSNQTIRVYYGKSGETTASNGADTFLEYSDVNDIGSWTNSVTAVGGDIRYNWSGVSVSTKTVCVAVPHIIESRFKSETTTNQNLYFVTGDGSGTAFATNRNIQVYQDAGVTTWTALDNSSPVVIYNSLALSTYYIAKEVQVASSDYDHYLYSDARASLLGSQLSTNYGYNGQVDPITGIQFGSGSGAWRINSYMTWLIVRKYAATEPTFSSAGAEQSTSAGWSGKIIGVSSPGNVNGIAAADISKILGVA